VTGQREQVIARIRLFEKPLSAFTGATSGDDR
jgi:hypothetical protein